MKNIKIGDKVVCIDPIDGLIKDAIYTVEDIRVRYDMGIKLKERPYCLYSHNFFKNSRFLKLDDYNKKESNIILENIKEQINQEELVEI